MADVQLKYGFFPIANALAEAIIYAPFSGTQRQIIDAFVRLTYGWGNLTVRVSVSELAERCNLRPNGGFRRALDELISTRVILEVQPGSGRRSTLWAINKDFEQWGRFTVHPNRLKDLYTKRPESDDKLLKAMRSVPPKGQSTNNKSVDSPDEDTPRSLPPEGQSTEDSPSIDGSMPPEGHSTPDRDEPLIAPPGPLDCPSRGIQTPPKSLFDETLQRRKYRNTESLLHNSLSSESESATTSRAPPPVPPITPPRTPPAPPPLDPLSLDSVSNRFTSIYDQANLAILATSVPSPITWLAEINASLDGMPGHTRTTPEQAGRAIREYVGNGAVKTPNLRQFRRYLAASASELPFNPPSTSSKGGARNDAAIDAWLKEREEANHGQ